jgi:hypothetical protein
MALIAPLNWGCTRAVNVTAFFDTRTFDEMWTRVTPR